MNKWILLLCFSLASNALFAQTYADSITQHRQQYKADFLTDKRSPITEADFPYLSFYAPNKNYRVTAKFVKIIDTNGFDMQTHSGVIKHYFVYGKLQFKLGNHLQTLNIYQSESLMQQDKYKEYLFLPFNDLTNNRTTYGGGRYLDFKISDIVSNTLVIDFNKCYNPYCAFGTGFNCPIPPSSNKLKVKILAGEKQFLKKSKL